MSNTTRARTLRNNMTEPEIILRSRLKHYRAKGYHFRRQAPLCGYIVDFLCFSRRLVIELDGSQHEEGQQALADHVRDSALGRGGFTVLRFLNAEVRLRLGRVLNTIEAHLEAGEKVR